VVNNGSSFEQIINTDRIIKIEKIPDRLEMNDGFHSTIHLSNGSFSESICVQEDLEHLELLLEAKY
jgi:hypothetical protein